MAIVAQCIRRFDNGAVMYACEQDLLVCQHILLNKPINKLTQQHIVTRVYWSRPDGTREGDYSDIPTTSHLEAVRYAWQDATIEVEYCV